MMILPDAGPHHWGGGRAADGILIRASSRLSVKLIRFQVVLLTHLQARLYPSTEVPALQDVVGQNRWHPLPPYSANG